MIWHPELSVILIESIPEDCTIHALVWIGKNVSIGHRVKIEAFAFIPEGVTIGNRVFIGPHVCFTNDKRPPSDDRCTWLPTFVEDGASIGANVTVVCGVTIGKNAMVGAGSVVTKDIPAGELWYGNPARKRGVRKVG